MMAPVPALPLKEPIAAPVPAPRRPPDTARSPGVVPQAEIATAVSNTADAVKREILFNMALSRFRVAEFQRLNEAVCSLPS
jgi:hypothetical protein